MNAALGLVLVAGLALAPRQAQREPPSAEEVEHALERLEQAFSKQGDSAARVEALERAADVPDARVVAWIAKGLADRDGAVVIQAVETLRVMDHPDALELLHRTARRDRRLKKDPELHARVLKAIGQHASPASIDVLTDGIFASQSRAVVEARILGLGRIRTRESVETLINLMNRTSYQKAAPYMNDMRLSLLVLTGTDEGRSRDAWMRWWNENKRTLEVSASPPKLPRADQMRWNRYWGLSGREPRQPKRGERGRN